MTSTWVEKKTRKDGTSTYAVHLRAGGRGSKRKVVASGIPSKREADKLAREAKLAAEQARAGVFQARVSVADALDAYEQYLEGKASHGNAVRVGKLHLRPALGAVELVALERAQVQALAEAKLAEGLGPQTLRHIVGTLRAAWRRAARSADAAKLLDGRSCPAEGIELPRIRARKKERLSLAELEATLPQLEDPWRDMAGAAVWTMMRPGELFALRTTDVDVDARLVHVHNSWERDIPKDGDDRTIPLFQTAVPYFERALVRAKQVYDLAVENARKAGLPPPSPTPFDEGGLYVFPDANSRMMPRTNETKLARKLRTAMIAAAQASPAAHRLVTAWALKCRRRYAGTGTHCHYETVVDRLPAEGPPRCPRCGYRLWPVGRARPVRWYDLRHTGASLLIQELGVDPVVVSHMLGHHDLELTMRTYVSLSTAGMLRELDRAARKNPDTGAPPVPLTRRGAS